MVGTLRIQRASVVARFILSRVVMLLRIAVTEELCLYAAC